jgi:hypothetical protein
MHKTITNPTDLLKGMAYNGSDHFMKFTPAITNDQRMEAHEILELALNDESLPEGWICVRGTRVGNPTEKGRLDSSESHTSGYQPDVQKISGKSDLLETAPY